MADEPTEPDCATCAFFHGRVECHRFPPYESQSHKIHKGGNTYFATLSEWPHVGADDWCGEYVAIADEPPPPLTSDEAEARVKDAVERLTTARHTARLAAARRKYDGARRTLSGDVYHPR